jgi:hypothetical protein
MPLLQTDRQIITLVVRRFAEARMPTERKEILGKFKPHGPDAIHRLTSLNVLNELQSRELIPRPVAFHLCGMSNVRDEAKSTFGKLAPVLQHMCENPPSQLTTEVLLHDLERYWPEAQANPILMWLGLYQCFEMGLIRSWVWNKEPTEIQQFYINDGVMGVDTARHWEDYIEKHTVRIEAQYRQGIAGTFLQGLSDLGNRSENSAVPPIKWSELFDRLSITVDERNRIVHELLREGLIRKRPPASDILVVTQKGKSQLSLEPYYGPQEEFDEMSPGMASANSRKVFLVHGHDKGVKHDVARFLERLKLDVVILDEKPSKSRTVIEKFEQSSGVAFAVVLLTPDDACGSGKTKTKRARQNVLLELGYFFGKLGRDKVCAIHVKGVELPSDILGVIWIPYDEGGGWQLKLAREINAAGIDVDLSCCMQ